MSITSGQYEFDGLRRLDPQVIGAVHDWYGPDVYRFVRYRLVDQTLAERASTDVFVRLLEEVHAGQNPATRLRTWLLEIAAQLVSERKGRAYAGFAVGAPAALGMPHKESGAGDPLRLLWSSIPVLTEEQQNVLALRFGVGYSPEETAALMKKNVAMIKRLQFHALAVSPAGMFAEENLCDTLQACLQALEHGADLEICLARARSFASVLQPLLETAVRAREAAVCDIPADAMQRARASVLRRAAELRDAKHQAGFFIPLWFKSPVWSHTLQWVCASAATVTLVVVGSSRLADFKPLPADPYQGVKVSSDRGFTLEPSHGGRPSKQERHGQARPAGLSDAAQPTSARVLMTGDASPGKAQGRRPKPARPANAQQPAAGSGGCHGAGHGPHGHHHGHP